VRRSAHDLLTPRHSARKETPATTAPSSTDPTRFPHEQLTAASLDPLQSMSITCGTRCCRRRRTRPAAAYGQSSAEWVAARKRLPAPRSFPLGRQAGVTIPKRERTAPVRTGCSTVPSGLRWRRDLSLVSTPPINELVKLGHSPGSVNGRSSDGGRAGRGGSRTSAPARLALRP
jgi:hypothetical protein